MFNVKVNKKRGKLAGTFAVDAYVDEPILPDVTPEDVGKVIGVDENGELEAITIPVPETKHLYRHQMSLNITGVSTACIFELYCDRSTPFTWNDLQTFMLNKMQLSTYDRWYSGYDYWSVSENVLTVHHDLRIRYHNNAFSCLDDTFVFNAGNITKTTETRTISGLTTDLVAEVY